MVLTVVSSTAAMLQSAPGGLGYLSEVFEAGKLRDRLSHEQLPDAWLPQSVRKLQRRYPKRIRARWVDPYSLMGLYLVTRFRIRSFPTIIVDNKQVLDPGGDPTNFENLIVDLLSHPDT